MPTKPRPALQKGSSKSSASRPRPAQRQFLAASLSDLARKVGCHRSTVTRAAQGPLRAAMNGDRIDLGHPLVVAWVREHTTQPEAPARASYGGCGGCGELYGTYAGTPLREFALRAEQPITTVRAALRAELAPALLKTGLIDIGHPAALAFLARFPLARDPDDDGPLDPPIDGHDFTCPACIDENRHDVRHPIFRAFLARYVGRMPTDADAAEFPSP